MGNPAKLDELAIKTIRGLSMDAVQAANSGHPGTPMGLAPLGWLFSPSCDGTIRPTRTGRTATASSCPVGMRRCCSTRCST